jgi:hypothetical protein
VPPKKKKKKKKRESRTNLEKDRSLVIIETELMQLQPSHTGIANYHEDVGRSKEASSLLSRAFNKSMKMP